MTAYYKARFIASINNVNLKKNFAQQELYLVIVAQKGSTNQQEFAVTLLKEGNAESASFIGTSVMTVEGFDRLKKAYNLDCKFEDFPKLVAHVIDSLEVTKKNFVHVHIVEDYCSVNFVKSDEWHFMLNFKVISSDVVGYLLEVVQNLQIRVDQEDLQMQNLQKQMEQTQILSHEKSSPVQVNPEMSPTRSEIGSNNMRNSFNGQCVETDQNQGYVDLTKLHEIPLNNKQQQQYSRITPPQSSSYNNFVPPQHMPTFTNPGQQQSMVPPPTSAPFHNPFTYGPGLASSHILRKPHPLPHNYSTAPSQMPTNSTFSHNPAQLIPQLVSGQSTPLTTYPNMSYS